MVNKKEIDSLLEKGNLRDVSYSLFPILGGANNQVFQLDIKDHPSLILKKYFFHPDDRRNRLLNESRFLTYAQECGITNVTRLIALSEEDRLGLYSFCQGRKALISDVNPKNIDQFIQFFLNLNTKKELVKDLPLASEAALTIGDYFPLVERRLKVLTVLSPVNHVEEVLLDFVKNELSPIWERVKMNAEKKIQLFHLDPNERLHQSNLCITPSDFGFHNVLIDGYTLNFIDFEYAGWDDPVKTIADFFCQPKIPISRRYFQKIKKTFLSTIEKKDLAEKRLEIVFPICQVKWCCVILNIFQKVGKRRREFAKIDEREGKQLDLAKRFLKKQKRELLLLNG